MGEAKPERLAESLSKKLELQIPPPPHPHSLVETLQVEPKNPWFTSLPNHWEWDYVIPQARTFTALIPWTGLFHSPAGKEV